MQPELPCRRLHLSRFGLGNPRPLGALMRESFRVHDRKGWHARGFGSESGHNHDPDCVRDGQRSGPFFFSERVKLVVLMARDALPTIFAEGEQARAGGLISYGASRADAYRQTGSYVGRIVKGEKPADLDDSARGDASPNCS